MLKEGLQAKGRVRFILRNKDGVVVQDTTHKNLVVDIGLDHIVANLASDFELNTFGSYWEGRRFEIRALSDGTTLTVDGAQAADTNIQVTTNTGIDSDELPLSISGSGISAGTFITSLSGTTVVSLNQTMSGVADAATLQVGETDFTGVGASSNTVGTTFTLSFDSDSASTVSLGSRYEIVTPGTSDFTTVGATNNLAGTQFTSSGTVGGNGTVRKIAEGTGIVRPAKLSHMALGSGVAARTAEDSDLNTTLGYAAIARENIDPASITYNANFGPGVATGAITEAGIFNDNSAEGDMLCSTTFPTINKGSEDSLEVVWVVTMVRP